jgi:hypothetical protein
VGLAPLGREVGCLQDQEAACQLGLAVECPLVPVAECLTVPVEGCQQVLEADARLALVVVSRLVLEVECLRAQVAGYQPAPVAVVAQAQALGVIDGIALIRIVKQQLIEPDLRCRQIEFPILGLKRKIQMLVASSRAGFTQQIA